MSHSSFDPAEASVPVSESTQELVSLTIEAATPFTEIRLLDARFEAVPLPANTGGVDVLVSPGLYEVGFRGCDDWDSQHVIAQPGTQRVVVRQQAPASGSSSLTETVSKVAQPPAATVVVILAESEPGAEDLGAITVELVRPDGSQTLSPDLTPNARSVWCFPAEAGFWRLRINETAARQPFEMAITVVPDYVAHVMAPLLARDAELRVDLDKLRFRLVRRGDSDVMNEKVAGFEEAALSALSSGRSLFGPSIEQLVDDLAGDKAANPMLGILAAHLCERSDDSHFVFRERLLERLEDLTGGPGVHPDVAVLRLNFAVRHGRATGAEPAVQFPPILAASWRMLLHAAQTNPALIPPGSLCERIADRLWSSSLWTAWTAPPLEAQPATRAHSVGGVEFRPLTRLQGSVTGNQIAELLGYPEMREWFRGASLASPDETDGLAWESDAVTPAEAAVATALFPIAKTEEHQSLMLRWADRLGAQSAQSVDRDPLAMAGQLGLPQSTVERALTSLASKLGSQASIFNIKL